MNTDGQSLLLLLGGGGFAGYLLLKALIAGTARGGEAGAARQRIVAAKRQASDRSRSTSDRAAAMRDAAVAALEGLQRPSLAAAYARRAERLEPRHPDTASLLGRALRRGARYSALERFLWRRLADLDASATEAWDRTFEELLALYEGPLRRPETASVMRRLRATNSAAAPQPSS